MDRTTYYTLFDGQLAYCCLKALTIGGGARALDDNSISLSSIIHLLFAFSDDDDDESKGWMINLSAVACWDCVATTGLRNVCSFY